MSNRGGGNYRGRGGSNQRGRGGGNTGARNGGGSKDQSAGHASGPRPQKFEQQLDSLSLKGKAAVDGTPLQMDPPVAKPSSNPMPSNKMDAKAFQDVVKDLKASGIQTEFPLREGFATPSTSVYTNHFAIKLDANTPLYEYNIIGLPTRISKRTARILIKETIDKMPFLKDNQDKFTTDYQKKLISWVKIPDLGRVGVSSTERRLPVDISLEEVGQIDMELLQRYSEGKEQPTQRLECDVKPASKALNMVVSTALSKGSISLKANRFFMTGGHNDLSLSLCAIRGYYYSIRPGMGQILLNLSSCTSAFYRPILVSDFLNDTSTFPLPKARLAQLRGLRVQLMYDPVHSGKKPRSAAATIEARLKSIKGTGLPVCEQKFPLKGRNGAVDTETTVQAHFSNTYKIKPLNPRMPAINCGTDELPKWYLPEKLQILPYQLYKRMVPEALTSNMHRVACRPPDITRALVEHEGLRQLGLNPGTGLTPLSTCPAIQIDSRMLQVPATTLPYPKPRYGKGSVGVDMRNPNWDLRNRKFLLTNPRKTFKAFIIAVPRGVGGRSIFDDPKILENTFGEFKNAVQDTYATASFSVVGSMINRNIGANPAVLEGSMEQAKAKGANFVMLFLEKANTPAYSTFKDLADRKFGMHSLCIVWKGKPSGLQYWGNVAMKINLKAGGTNHTSDGVEHILKDTLVLGADVTHASPGSGALLGTPSIAAIVGSVDQTGGKFLGSMRLQPFVTSCEDIQDVEGMVLERIKAWFLNNKRTLPKNILYYRDGVSDSQYSQVKDNELPQIGKAFGAAAKSVGLTQVPKFRLTAYVVAKRHHVKLFPQPQDAMPRNGNCKPGTLVDSAITSPYYGDFYLQSHNGIKGTAKSAHYFPLVNEMGLTDVQMQTFTHKLCYTYVRATLGVSYAPPAYYADRLCDRGRHYIRDFLSPSPPMHDQISQLRRELTNKATTKREAEFKPKCITVEHDERKIRLKSELEKVREATDEKDVEDEIKAKTFARIKAEFYGGEVERNPWHENIADTMFWM